jgi:hypothetical protein
MRRAGIWRSFVAGAMLLAVPASASASSPPSSPVARAAAVSSDQARDLGKQAYDYGLPLLEFLRVRAEETSVRCPDGMGNAPVNSFSNARGFARPEDRTVVAPNTDTLYSIAHLDLARGPIVLSHPDMGKRYYSFELLDPYTNVIDIRGARKDGFDAGRFEIRWNHAPGKAERPPHTPLIKSKYRRVWVIGRTLATGPADQRKARKLMARYRLTRLGGKARRFSKGCKPGAPKDYATPTDGPGFITALNRALKRNPPPKRDEPLLSQLAAVGVGAGKSPDGAGLPPDVLVALYDGVAHEAASLPGATRLMIFNQAKQTGGWLLPASNIGNYGTDYLYRAQIAVVGLGANTPNEAIYPTGITDASGTLYSGANRYRLTFPSGEEPPARYFWSLTMYDSDGYLVANPINRYSVGSSHPPLLKQPDGSIVIAIQHDPPTEPRVNWLPAPAAGGFRLNLRLYGPSVAARTGVWRPPGVVKVG